MDQQLAAKYPEHMKLEAIPQSDRDAIGQFIEWLDSRGYTIAKYREEGTNGEPRYIPATEADIAEIRRYKGYEGSAIERQALTKGVENPNYEYNPSGFYPVHTNPEKWLTDYYSIRPNSSGIIYRWRQDYPRYSCREWTFDTGITPGIHARKPETGLPLAFMPGSPHHRSFPMYDFSPSPEQQTVLDRTNAIMREHIYPAEAEYSEDHGLPEARMRELQAVVKRAGLWAPHLPKEAGGLGMGMLTLGLMNEILGRSPIAPRAFGTNAPDTGNQEILWLAGTPEQKEKYLTPSVAGEIYSAFAMTEPEYSGSDPVMMGTTAVLDGDQWVINGHKWFTSSGSRASFLIVMAVTEPERPPHERASMLIVEKGTPGFNLIRDVPVMGDDFGAHSEIRFEDCRVPAANLLGQRGAGFLLAQARLGPGRITHCMRWIGVMTRSFELMLARAQTRETRGKKLAEFETVQNYIADSYADIQTSRLLTLHAAWQMDRGGDARKEISLIKFHGANALQRVIDRAIQVHGALGFSKDTPLEAYYREARAARIYDGVDEVHRQVVAKRLLKEFAREREVAHAG